MPDAAIITCALTGVLTNPKTHPVPVTPEEMAAAARQAWDGGATVVHLHFRNQTEGFGHLPTWDPQVCADITAAIRAEVPEILINSSTGVMGPDISGPLACIAHIKPEIAALNAGSLNYLKLRSNGNWAWPPLLFDNPVNKIEEFLGVMKANGIVPECEAFDTGIVRSVAMFKRAGMLSDPTHVSFVMGVASGMPARAELLPLLIDELPEGAHFQSIVIGRQEVWPIHRRCAELGGDVRTGLEDTFYLPNGERATSNGQLVDALATLVRETGREPANIAQTRAAYGIS